MPTGNFLEITNFFLKIFETLMQASEGKISLDWFKISKDQSSVPTLSYFYNFWSTFHGRYKNRKAPLKEFLAAMKSEHFTMNLGLSSRCTGQLNGAFYTLIRTVPTGIRASAKFAPEVAFLM